MTTRDISTAKDPDLRASMAAIQRAAELARQTAIQTNTELVIVRDGRIVHLSAQELCHAPNPRFAHQGKHKRHT